MTTIAAAPKAFVSYSWSSETHEAWVVDLATRLVQDGVEVVLDKWDLKVGHDANAFMETMVTDASVTKVLLVCDRIYAEKANSRLAGVGKEAQILTREIYERVDQDKYAALITERDTDGKAIIPAYYGGRRFIDFSQPELAETGYEELLRWIFDKPRYVKPKLGQAPAFIVDPDAVVTGTASKFKRAEDAIRAGSAGSGGFIADFGEALIAEMNERAPENDFEPFDEEVIRAAGTIRPGIRNLIDLVLAEARFGGNGFDRILGIYERMGRLMYRPEHVQLWSEEEYDPYRMVCYEAFIGLVAVLIQERRFDLLGAAVNYRYLINGRDGGGGNSTTTSFRVFAQGLPSFERRKRRLQSSQNNLHADLIAETYSASFPRIDDLVEADFLLFLRGMIIEDGTDYESWWPRLILYARRGKVLNLFARSESLSFFNNWAPKVFGPITLSEFQTKLTALAEEIRGSYGYPSPNVVWLTNAKQLGTSA